MLTGKAACYCMTRNIYHKVIPSLKSLLMHSDVDRVYLLTEDDDIGFTVPDRVRIVNVRGQKFFRADGPNYSSPWTWMVMMRVALCHVLTDESKVLSLDCDTLVLDDISHMWDWDMRDFYYAACPEPGRAEDPFKVYVNAGVVLWNLDKARDGMADRLIEALNTKPYRFNEQDAMNELCNDDVMLMGSEYNASRWTGMPRYPYIRHFAAEHDWYSREPLVREYRDILWQDCVYTGVGM